MLSHSGKRPSAKCPPKPAFSPMVLSGSDLQLIKALHHPVPKWVPALMAVVPFCFLVLAEMAHVPAPHAQQPPVPTGLGNSCSSGVQMGYTSRRNLSKSICCLIVPMLYYFGLGMTTDYFAVTVVEFIEKYLLASVLPLSVRTGWSCGFIYT